MSRKLPAILLSKNEGEFTNQILEADKLWVVTYRGKPFNLKYQPILQSQTILPRYAKTVFLNPGFAIVLAKRLNSQFKTTDFAIVEIDYSTDK